ncbi:MAG: histidinol dehydrogenase, partial [Oscillospiraceae bacterium]
MIKIYNTGDMSVEDIIPRKSESFNVAATVTEIITRVREIGDSALREYGRRFDGASPALLEVTEEERKKALLNVEPEFLEIMKEAAENIRNYHSRQIRSGYIIQESEGIILGQKVTPLASVGLYIPGGTASYPSSVLMNCIPAKLAGVGQIVMTTPPDKNGSISPNIIAAADLAGVDRIFKIGGAQAIAALAYGTESVPKVDKIVGPGNAYVAEAKRQVFGIVGIDMIAGPSEVLAIADGKSDPAVLAADLLSQAEHDKLATAVLITDSKELGGKVAAEIEKQLKKLPREEIARASIEQNGKIIIARSI